MNQTTILLLIGGNVLLFLFLFLTVRSLYKGITESKRINEISKRIVAFSKKNEQTRLNEEKRRQILEGASNQESFLYKIDRKIMQSGLKELSTNITTELFLTMYSILALALALLGGLFFGGWGALIGFLLGGIIPWLVLSLFAKKRYKQIEKQILTFMNLVDSYSKTSDDIIDILGKIHFYLEEPLSSALEDCYNEAHMSGDSELALRNLTERIGHEKMEEIITNIEIASRHEADYSVVINDERELVSNYLFDKKEKESLLRSSRIELLILVGIGYLVVAMLADSFDLSLASLYRGDSISSIVIIIVTAITALFAVKNLLFSK